MHHDGAAPEAPRPREPGPRAAAVRAATAGHLGDTAAARAGLGDPDAHVRTVALRAVRRLGELTAADVGRALEDPDPGVRRAALTVAATSGVATVDVVLPLLDDPDAAVAENAAWALGELPTPGAARSGRRRVEALARTAATHPDPLCREAAVAALGAVGDPAGLPAVLAALGDKPAVRRRAVVALAAFDDPRADAALLVAAGDRDRQVRETAEELLAVPPGGGDPGDEPD